MAEIKRFAPYFLIVAAFIFGIFISKKPDPEVERLHKKERAEWELDINRRDARIVELTKAGQAISLKAEQDSIRFAGLLKAKEITIQKLKTKADAVNYQNYKAADLDSVRSIILRAR